MEQRGSVTPYSTELKIWLQEQFDTNFESKTSYNSLQIVYTAQQPTAISGFSLQSSMLMRKTVNRVLDIFRMPPTTNPDAAESDRNNNPRQEQRGRHWKSWLYGSINFDPASIKSSKDSTASFNLSGLPQEVQVMILLMLHPDDILNMKVAFEGTAFLPGFLNHITTQSAAVNSNKTLVNIVDLSFSNPDTEEAWRSTEELLRSLPTARVTHLRFTDTYEREICTNSNSPSRVPLGRTLELLASGRIRKGWHNSLSLEVKILGCLTVSELIIPCLLKITFAGPWSRVTFENCDYTDNESQSLVLDALGEGILHSTTPPRKFNALQVCLVNCTQRFCDMIDLTGFRLGYTYVGVNRDSYSSPVKHLVGKTFSTSSLELYGIHKIKNCVFGAGSPSFCILVFPQTDTDEEAGEFTDVLADSLTYFEIRIRSPKIPKIQGLFAPLLKTVRIELGVGLEPEYDAGFDYFSFLDGIEKLELIGRLVEPLYTPCSFERLKILSLQLHDNLGEEVPSEFQQLVKLEITCLNLATEIITIVAANVCELVIKNDDSDLVPGTLQNAINRYPKLTRLSYHELRDQPVETDISSELRSLADQLVSLSIRAVNSGLLRDNPMRVNLFKMRQLEALTIEVPNHRDVQLTVDLMAPSLRRLTVLTPVSQRLNIVWFPNLLELFVTSNHCYVDASMSVRFQSSELHKINGQKGIYQR